MAPQAVSVAEGRSPPNAGTLLGRRPIEAEDVVLGVAHVIAKLTRRVDLACSHLVMASWRDQPFGKSP